MSKSLLILFVSVALLSAGSSLQTGAPRFGDSSLSPRAEFRADLAAVKSDLREIGLRLADAPLDLHALWEDLREDYTTLRADAAFEARTLARRIATLFNTASL